jgi:hypothetical protein
LVAWVIDSREIDPDPLPMIDYCGGHVLHLAACSV